MKAWCLGTLLGGLFAAGCAGPDFDENRAKWQRERPDEYVMVSCGTGFDPGCTLDAVSGSEIVAHANSVSRAPTSDEWEYSEDYPKPGDPVEELFDAAKNQGDACELERIAFDDRFGFVADYYEDCGEEGGGRRVACFKPDTVDVTLCGG